MLVTVVLSLLVAACTFGGAHFLGHRIVETRFFSQTAVNERLRGEINSFRDYVARYGVSSTNVQAIGDWNRDHRTVQMSVNGLYTTVNSGPSGAELVLNENGLVVRSGALAEGAVEFPVNFRDGVFSVAIYDNSRGLFQLGVNGLSLMLAALVFLVLILIYNQYITRLICTLSRQVRLVSRGALQKQIEPMSHDEIGQLARDVDAMRLSIIDKLQREEEALKANSQLITAISHDVRTPLTALMGYLEILSDEGLSPQERSAYLDVCKNNAARLKSLTDELFGFFLVFGKDTPDQVLEEFDAATLLDQILLEHEMGLHQNQLELRQTEQGDPTGRIRVDLGHLRRIFDNLYSNILKYADRSQPVLLEKWVEADQIHIRLTNAVAADQPRAESNRIGLQTCDKLAKAMGAEVRCEKSPDRFQAEVILPLIRS